ncbi:TIGR03751 family conjugal transfer lipoprotein [Billgrantia ethanolica]|nr:TIGR03751 family conjugal transfer lipoprotein [Halomonas ethanolica]
MVLAVGVVGLGLLSGCATSKDEMWQHDGVSMQELWRQGGAGGGGDSLSQRGLLDARGELRRALSDGELLDQRLAYTRDATNEIYSQFTRLPNPDLVMYVFPHLAGAEVPIPGYSTVFSLYTRPQYAMPGETSRPRAPEPERRPGLVTLERSGDGGQ